MPINVNYIESSTQGRVTVVPPVPLDDTILTLVTFN
jgi:hypothetical protein